MTLGVIQTDTSALGRSHETLSSVIIVTRFTHNLVIEEKKPRMICINRDLPSGKRASWVGVVGAVA